MGRSLVTPQINAYVANMVHETPVQKRLREETQKMPQAVMQIGPDQGAFFTFLARLLGIRKVVEVGTFTGYSALALALGMPEDGRIVACDVSAEWTGIAKRYWQEAGVAERIDLRLGPAGDTLASLLTAGGGNSFDFAFIDADKGGYAGYYEQCLQLVRPGGLIALDNMLWSGQVAEAGSMDEQTRALHELNQLIRNDRRVEACLMTLGDGVLLVRKK